MSILCIDTKTYEDAECGKDTVVVDRQVLNMDEKSKKGKISVGINNEYNIVLLKVLKRGCFNVRCEKCEVVNEVENKCGNMLMLRIVSKGSGDLFVEYKHDLVYIYVMYVGIAIFVVACVILIFVVARMLIFKNKDVEIENESIDDI